MDILTPKKLRMISLPALFLILTFLTSCTMTSGLKDVDTTLREPRWERITDSGVSLEAGYNNFTKSLKLERESRFFTPEDEHVTWWALFHNLTFAGAMIPTFEAKWYGPSGEIYKSETFRKSIMHDFYLETKLPVAGTAAAEMTGEWFVEIYFKNSLVDRRFFHIITEDMKAAYPPYLDFTSRKQSFRESLKWVAVKPKPEYEPERAPRAEPEPETVPEPEPLKAAQPSAPAFRAEPANTQAVPVPVPAKAPPVASKASNADQSWFDDNYVLGLAHFQNHDYDKARAVFEEILDKQPYRTEAHFALGSIYAKQKNWDDAVRELDYTAQNPAFREKALELRSQILEMKNAAGAAA